jgi:hypothetical protein
MDSRVYVRKRDIFRPTKSHSEAHNNSKQGKQFTYKLAVRRVAATIVEVENQYVLHILSVCL